MSSLYDPYRGLYSSKELAKIRTYMKEEMERSFEHYGKKEKPGAYYMGYLFRNIRHEKISGRLGAIHEHSVQSRNSIYCDLRVGSYRYDNVTAGGLNEPPESDESPEPVTPPCEIEEDSFKYALWKSTDGAYRVAADEYYRRKSRELHYVDPNRKLLSMTKREASRSWKPAAFHEVDIERILRIVRKAGALVKEYPAVKNSLVEFESQHIQSILLNTEGSEILQQSAIFELHVDLWLLTPKGEGVVQEINLIEGDPAELPSEEEFLRMVREKLEFLIAVQTAPLLNSYSGPVLLSPKATGLFFHEVIGHRLEGSRLLSPEEGGTFHDLRNARIAPDFIDIIDDPTLDRYQGKPMVGAFRYDDEGSPARKAVLVEGGVLKRFLTTASPIPDQKELNGHARNQKGERPVSRMGNLIVINHEPKTKEEMHGLFLEEIRRQKKPYGIHIRETLGGETETASYDFQAFKGEILHAVRVYPDGREEPVRGVDFVGTPLSALDSVVAMGDDPELDNGYCGAESGVIPVSTVAPSMLMKNLELQGRDRERYTQFSLPLPYQKNSKRK